MFGEGREAQRSPDRNLPKLLFGNTPNDFRTEAVERYSTGFMDCSDHDRSGVPWENLEMKGGI